MQAVAYNNQKMLHTSSPLFSLSPACTVLPEAKKPNFVSDSASDSTSTETRPRTTPRTHLKVKVTHRTRLFKLTKTQGSRLRLVASIEHMLQKQAPVVPHSTALTAMPLDQKRNLLAQLRKRVTVIEATISKASAALQLLVQYM